jgi:hypothetical protein
MKMELDHEKPDISLGEIVYVYEYVNENDYAITQTKPQQAGTDSNVRAEVCGGLRRNQPYLVRLPLRFVGRSYTFTAERYTFPVHEHENGTRP